ncbi:hypothetical protein BBG03_03340 [Streptococcus dysgalactiae subsp. equisimilis]|uniref:hypothetical protein n=1 Tax=Streptococcus dysgalactiae TaxID=1334 RepID=UPI0008071C4E|nr:hypothetical protein [Streptococcus dysgalactiae]OBZ00629.1 hypothetical protein BBG03_03340 [Streptococcus dysgalactiae subsp. equisimilis]
MKQSFLKNMAKIGVCIALAGAGVSVQTLIKPTKVEAASYHDSRRLVSSWVQSLGGNRWRRVYRYSDGSYGYGQPFYYYGWFG